MTLDRARITVLLLAAQALCFGVASALLVIPANGVFLAAYGAEWLPLTYVGIAALGTPVSLVMARSLRRWNLPAVAVAVLASIAATLAASWAVIEITGSAWPSVLQLMMFPVLLQLGFVIIGGQAGRLLDLQQIKRHFPRIVAGFVIGFMVGGFAAVPLLDLFGDPARLVAGSAASCIAFAVLVRATARRRPAELTVVDQPAGNVDRPSLRSLLTTRFVVLVFTYQVLSAMGSQVLDFLVFDRAAARYDDASELTRFVAVYTGVMNAVNIVFLLALAGWLLSRFGLKFGLFANPAVVTALAIGMLVAVLGPGPSSLALFSLVAVARIIDIALSDGMTRTSINGIYQVLPIEERMAVQASVEGVGVPVAIGATGVMLIVMNALGLGTSALVTFALVLCAAWTVAAGIAWIDFRRALAARLRRRGLDLDSARPLADDEQTAARRLVLTDDVRDLRLGLDLAVFANLARADLAHLTTHEDREVQLLALGQLARRGDGDAAARAVTAARALAASADVAERRAAAVALADVQPPDREQLLGGLVADPDVTVRAAALGSVDSNDVGLADVVVSALDHPSTVEAAVEAARRLGAPAMELAADRLRAPGPPAPRLLRLVGAIDVSAQEAAAVLGGLVVHPDRRVSTAALAALARHGASVDTHVLDALLADDSELAASTLAASISMTDADVPVRRALDDIVDVVRDRVLAVLAVRYGEERMAGARRALSSPDGARRALGIEMLHISLTRREIALVDAVARVDLDPAERLRRLRVGAEVAERGRSTWLGHLVADEPTHRADPWLQAVALHAELVTAPEVAARHAHDIDVTSRAPATPAEAALAEVVLVAAAAELH